jgi:hypothetical protein
MDELQKVLHNLFMRCEACLHADGGPFQHLLQSTVSLCYLFTVFLQMCACTETDVRESVNDSIHDSGEGHGRCGETLHPSYAASPVSSVAESTVHLI